MTFASNMPYFFTATTLKLGSVNGFCKFIVARTKKDQKEAMKYLLSAGMAILAAVAFETIANGYGTRGLGAAWGACTILLSSSAGLIGASGYLTSLMVLKVHTVATAEFLAKADILETAALFVGALGAIVLAEYVRFGVLDMAVDEIFDDL